MKTNLLKFSIVLTVIFTFILSSCKSDDNKPNGFHPNGIKILTQDSIEIKISNFSIDNGSQVNVSHIEPEAQIQDIEGDFLALENEDNTIIYIKTDNGEISDLIIYVNAQGVAFFGEVGEVNENDDNGLQVTGTLSDEDDNEININIVIYESQIGTGTSEIEVTGENAYVSGVLGTQTYNQVLEINANFPNVTTFILTEIDGSENDDVNVNTGRLIREAGYATHVPSNGAIASGGVDLFTSGVKRTKDTGATIGVHSWCCYEGLTAVELPIDSPGHDLQLAYFREMLGDENGSSFYFFTLQAAPFNGIHNMTDAELAQYQLLTE